MKNRQIIWGIGGGLLGAYVSYKYNKFLETVNEADLQPYSASKDSGRALMCILPALLALGGAWGAQ